VAFLLQQALAVWAEVSRGLGWPRRPQTGWACDIGAGPLDLTHCEFDRISLGHGFSRRLLGSRIPLFPDYPVDHTGLNVIFRATSQVGRRTTEQHHLFPLRFQYRTIDGFKVARADLLVIASSLESQHPLIGHNKIPGCETVIAEDDLR
jgi:hypothetical protein